jgi:hypothetical protein
MKGTAEQYACVTWVQSSQMTMTHLVAREEANGKALAPLYCPPRQQHFAATSKALWLHILSDPDRYAGPFAFEAIKALADLYPCRK